MNEIKTIKQVRFTFDDGATTDYLLKDRGDGYGDRRYAVDSFDWDADHAEQDYHKERLLSNDIDEALYFFDNFAVLGGDYIDSCEDYNYTAETISDHVANTKVSIGFRNIAKLLEGSGLPMDTRLNNGVQCWSKGAQTHGISFAGFYAISRHIAFSWNGSYVAVKGLIAEECGLEDGKAFEDWLHQNPKLWGNEWGNWVFIHHAAFVGELKPFTLKDTINQLIDAAKRIEADRPN